MKQRSLSKSIQTTWHQGFLGPGHHASAILDGIPYAESDPFILFMDDKLDLPGGEPVGGAHPHAGFETLTLVLEGNGKDWETGSFELMTAGKGIVHTEEITSEQKLRILQVWLALPPEKRYAPPFWQKISLKDVPKIRTDHYEIRVYSGSSNGLTASLQNHTAFTLVDFRLENNAQVSQEIPSEYSGLVYVLNGRVKAGGKILEAGQTGWLSKMEEKGNSELQFLALENDTHFVLYAGQPHRVPIVQHGPFIADSMEEIARFYKQFREGEFPHLNDLPEEQKIDYSRE